MPNHDHDPDTDPLPAKERLRALIRSRSDNRGLRFAYKLWQLRRHHRAARAKPAEAVRFLLGSREVSNFTYENANPEEMVRALATTLAVTPGAIHDCLAELDSDRELAEMLIARLRPNPLRGDRPLYGYRRISWCIVRLGKPTSVVECGTHDGLAASLILRALQRNAAEGEAGTLHTFDLTPDAGWLIPDSLRPRLSLQIGDVSELLGPTVATHGVDFFIEDFGHSFPLKGELIETALAAAAGPRMIVLTECDDNPTLSEIAIRTGGRYDHFREQPLKHWWGGHDWGIASMPTAPAQD